MVVTLLFASNCETTFHAPVPNCHVGLVSPGTTMKKIGILGGTFDPIHHGHLILARDALEQLELESVIFIPAAISPHKLGRKPSDAEARLEMVRAAVAGEPRFCLDAMELERPAPSY